MTSVPMKQNLGSKVVGPGRSSWANPSPAKSSTASFGRGIKQLPYAEYLKRKEEGKCFRCGLKFGPLHKCPQRQLQVLILAEEPEAKEEGEFVMVETEKEDDLGDCEVLDVGDEKQELMLHVMKGVAEPHTFKIRGSIDGLTVVALIDSGASHNFLSKETATKLGLNGEKERSFWVRLGDGRKRQTNGVCRAVTLSLGGVDLLVDFHIFPLGGVDVILGFSWLRTLGNISFNWDNLSMEFKYGGKKVMVNKTGLAHSSE